MLFNLFSISFYGLKTCSMKSFGYICQNAEYSRYRLTLKVLIFTELNIRGINFSQVFGPQICENKFRKIIENKKFAKINPTIYLLKIFQKWHQKHRNHKSFHRNFSKISKFAKIHSAKNYFRKN